MRNKLSLEPGVKTCGILMSVFTLQEAITDSCCNFHKDKVVMEKSTDMRVLAFSHVNLLDSLSYGLRHAQPRCCPPRGASRRQRNQEHGRDFPSSCRDTQPTAYPDSRADLPTSSFPEPAEAVPVFQALSADPCSRMAEDQAALQGLPEYQLSRTSWCFVSSHTGW